MTLISEQLELGWRFNPAEHRNAHGEWSRDAGPGMKWTGQGAGYEHPPADRVNAAGLSGSANPFIAKYGLSTPHIVSAYDACTSDERAQGMRWYSDAHDVATAIGKGDAARGAAMLSAFSVQTDWATDVMNAASTMTEGKVPEHGVGITGQVRARAQAVLDAKSDAEIDKLFPAAGSAKTRNFYQLIRNGGDTPGDTEGHVVIDRHALSVAAGRRLTSRETLAPTYAEMKEEHPDWTPGQMRAYRATFPDDPTGSIYSYQHIADMYREAAKQVSERDGIQISPHQMQAMTWMHQLHANDADDGHLIEMAAETVRHGGKFTAVPGAAMAKGRASSMAKRWAAWGAYARAHQIPVVSGTTSLASLVSSQLLDLTGDGHGHHISGTPYLYRHGWKPASQFDTRRSEALERRRVAKYGAGRYAGELPLEPAPALDLWPQNLPAHHFRAVADYISLPGADAMNGALRRGEKPDPVHERDIQAMDSLIASHTLKQDAVVYRGMAMTPKWRDRLKPGAVFSDLGYTSTTTDPDLAARWASWRSKSREGAVPAVIEVSVPAGMHTAPGMPKLSEYVLPHGTQYRVDSVSPDGRHYKVSVVT